MSPQMSKTVDIIADLLEMYEVSTGDPDVAQNIINATVAIDNRYKGYDDEGNKIGSEASA